MKKIKPLLILLLIYSCNNKSNNENILKEINRLKQVELQYNKQSKLLNNSIIIPFDSLSNYLMPVSFGNDVLKVNEKVQFTTGLVLQKLPSNIKTKFVYNEKEVKLIDEKPTDLNRYLTQSFKDKGEKETYGEYIITLPNGNQKSFRWGRFVLVK
jgi:hypothetical protein